jgi:hypothetical protein
MAIKQLFFFSGAVFASYLSADYFFYLKTPNLLELDKNQQLIDALTEAIIPATDSPGASAAKVFEFVILMINDCSTRNEQVTFLEGLRDIKSFCQTNFGKSFINCTQEQQKIALLHFEAKGTPYDGIFGKLQTKLLGKSFFTILKEHTLQGYFTSMIGATQALAYLSIPEKYVGCTVFAT